VNSLVVKRPEDLARVDWPERSDPDRAQVLFLTSQVLGFKTWAAQLEEATASCDWVDAVHVHLHAPRLLKALGAWIPPTKGGFWHAWRHWLLWDRYVGMLLRHIPLAQFDAIHVTNQYNAAGFARLPAGIRARTVACVDATSALEHREFGYGIIDRAPLIAAERRLMKRLAGASGMTQWACESLVRDCQIDPRSVILARLGIAVTAGPVKQPHAGAHSARVAIIFIGNHWSRKGGERLLDWHQDRWRDRADLHLVGDSPEAVARLPGVVRHGSVERGRLVHQLLPSMDLMVMPTMEDCLPWVLLEAQAAGVPVVSTRMAGIQTDGIAERRTGFLCGRDADDEFIAATERLLDDPALRREMSLGCIERMRSEWDPARCAERYFREVLRLTARGTVVA
jgi:glycosyltransferase involved in cell wall biosynthesis